MILNDLIFSGKYSASFTILGFSFTFTTLSLSDEREIAILEQQRKSRADNILFIIDILSRTITAIQNTKFTKRQRVLILQEIPVSLLIKLYEKYKQIADEIIKDVDANFLEFAKSRESDIQWELQKLGYLWPQPLTTLQQSWIYLRKQLEINENFERQYNLAKYVVSHVTHATINAKSYVNMIKQQQHQEEAQRLQESGNYNDLSRQMFSEILQIHEKDPRKAEEMFCNSLHEKDDHDREMIAHALILFKNGIRNKRHTKTTIASNRVKPNVHVGMKQNVVIDNGKPVQDMRYIRDNINYIDIFKDKYFIDLTEEEKFKAFEEVLAEPLSSSEVAVKSKRSVKDLLAKLPVQEGKTVREIMAEKGLDGSVTLGQLGEK